MASPRLSDWYIHYLNHVFFAFDDCEYLHEIDSELPKEKFVNAWVLFKGIYVGAKNDMISESLESKIVIVTFT